MQNKTKIKIIKKIRRHRRVRSRVIGRVDRPRLVVFRSDKHIYAQIINDEKGHTLVSASDSEIKVKKGAGVSKESGVKMQVANQTGLLVAKKALEKNIKKVIFDRAGYKYHGRVKAVAEGAREGGLEF